MATLFINITTLNINADTGGKLMVVAELASDSLKASSFQNGFTINWATATNVSISQMIAAFAKAAFEANTGLSLGANPTYVFTGLAIAIQQGPPPLPAYEPFPSVTGSSFSSHQPASTWFNRVMLPQPVAISNVNIVKSVGVGVPAATSVASTGTVRHSYAQGLTVFARQDYSNNSTNFTTVASGSFGVTAGLTYSTGSQSVAISWVTDSAGGTTSLSTTSSNAGWSTFLTGTKMFKLPMVTSLSAGEYFVAHGHSTTTGTTGASNVTLMSYGNAHLGFPQTGSTIGSFGAGGSAGSNILAGFGVASAVVTSTTMAASVISVNASANNWYMNFSNA